MATNAEISSTTQNTIVKNPAAVPIYAGEELLTFGVSEMPPDTRIYIYCKNSWSTFTGAFKFSIKKE